MGDVFDKLHAKFELFTIGNYFAFMAYLNVKKILAVINTTYAVAKRKPEKIRLAGIHPGIHPGKPDDFFQAFFSQLHKLR